MSEYRGDDTGERVVVSTKEIAEGRTGGIDEFGNRHYTRVWNVLVNNINADALEVTATGSLPARFSAYQSLNGAVDLGATLRRYECEQLPELVQWRVTAYYDSTPTQTQFDYNPNDYGGVGGFSTGDVLEQTPIGRAVQVQWGSLRYQKALQKDLDDKPIATAAGQPFDPPVLVDRSYRTLQIVRNELSYLPNTAETYENKVNSVAWTLGGAINTTIAAGLAKCESITAQSMLEQGIFFWRVNYLFHINTAKRKDTGGSLVYEGWKPEIMHAGTLGVFTLPSGGKIIGTINDPRNGMPVTSAYPLNSVGLPLQPDAGGVVTPTWKVFRVYEEVDFNALGLP